MSRRSRFCRGSEQARPARARNAGARLAAWLQAGLASSTQPAFVPTRAGGLHPDGGSILADVLVPHLGVGRDPVAEHADAALVGEVNHVDAVLAQPLDPAVEVHRLAHHHGADVELPDRKSTRLNSSN